MSRQFEVRIERNFFQRINRAVMKGRMSAYANQREIEMSQDAEDLTIYRVVMNDEEMYSIWPADREILLGWRDVGKTGTRAEVLAYIEEVWTDMRPLSMRQAMERDRGE